MMESELREAELAWRRRYATLEAFVGVPQAKLIAEIERLKAELEQWKLVNLTEDGSTPLSQAEYIAVLEREVETLRQLNGELVSQRNAAYASFARARGRADRALDMALLMIDPENQPPQWTPEEAMKIILAWREK